MTDAPHPAGRRRFLSLGSIVVIVALLVFVVTGLLSALGRQLVA
jgi:hypothetical protein